ncbi:Vitamin B12 transporter BtuB [Sphingomonas antarctica]|uniref:TonB-dependent receptor n=1 Tax=Sphingomonas antarctica TaxID=2040274 RepID=UPI0039EC7C7D
MPALPPDPPIIVVTGQGLPAPVAQDAFGSVTIARDRLTGSASNRIEDVLSDAAGFQQFRRTDSRAANPTSQGATLRALGGNAASRVLVTLDGVPQDDPFAGYIPYSALKPETLGAARVTRGGGAGAFGAGALAGTIELFSRAPSPRTEASLAGGSRASVQGDALIGRRLGDGFVTIAGGFDRGDGYVIIPPDQRGPADVAARYRSWTGQMRAVVPVGNGELQPALRLFEDRRLRGLRGTDSSSKGADASLRFVGHGAWRVEALGYVQARRFTSGFVAIDAARAIVTPTLDQFNTPALGIGGKVEVRPPLPDNIVLRVGADARRQSGRTNERFRYVAGAPTALRRAGGVNAVAGLFAEGSAEFGALTLTGGARADHWRIADGTLDETLIGSGTPIQSARYPSRDGTCVSARAGGLWRASEIVRLRVAAYTGFRLPTLNELYRPFRVGADATAANAALGLERLQGAEGGLEIGHGATLSLTGFVNRLDGAIGNVTLGMGPGTFPQVGFVAAGGSFRQRLNLDAIDVTGAEAEARVPLGAFTLRGSLALADARVRTSGIAAGLNGLRPAQSPKLQATGSVDWTRDGWRLGATLRHSAGQYEDDQNVRRLPSATTMDAVVALPVGHGLQLTLRGENLFDARVVSGISSSGVQDLGTPRTLWVGLRFGGDGG